MPAALLAAAFAFTACDNTKAPGKDPIYKTNIDAVPPATATVTDLDSVNRTEQAPAPIGKGSAADISSSTDAALNSAPGGQNATTPQTASGRPAKSATSSRTARTKTPSRRPVRPAPPLLPRPARCPKLPVPASGSSGSPYLAGGQATTRRLPRPLRPQRAFFLRIRYPAYDVAPAPDFLPYNCFFVE